MTITLTREEAQQVLDALECMNEGALNAEIKLLRDRLAQPEPEPAACAASWFALVMCAAAEIEDASYGLRDEEAKRKAISGAKHYRDAANALYTAPPQRKWQGLTEDDWNEFMMDHLPSERYGHTRMRAVWEFSQSKLKAKNAP